MGHHRPGERRLTGYLLVAPSLLLFGAFFLAGLAADALLFFCLELSPLLQPARAMTRQSGKAYFGQQIMKVKIGSLSNSRTQYAITHPTRLK